MKLLCIGLDGLGPDHWHDSMHFDGWQALPLHSPTPMSGPAWVSIYTGLTPEQHGVGDVWGRKYDGNKGLVDVKKYAIWNELYARGYTCDIYGMPITWPASPVRPRFLSGFLQQDFSNWAYPDLPKRRQEWLRWSDAIWWTATEPEQCPGWMTRIQDQMTKAQFMKELEKCAKLYTAHFLSTREDADLVMVGYTFFDRANHLWYDPKRTGKLAKEIVERLVDALEPEKALLFSDHGFADVPGEKGGAHTNTGVLAAYGLHNLGCNDWHTWDICPLIGHIFDVELSRRPGGFVEKSYAELVEERLRALGYVV